MFTPTTRPTPARLTAMAAFMVLGFAASTANAATPTAPMQGCARVFTASLAVPAHTATPYDIRFLNHGVVSTEADYDVGVTTYDLVARDRDRGVIVANGQCTVNANDAVIALTTDALAGTGQLLAVNQGAK